MCRPSKTFDIRPRVEQQTDGNLVHLEISLEFDSFISGEGDDNSPSVQRQSLSTTVSTRDGETIVLGGMRDESGRRHTYFALTSQIVEADAQTGGAIKTSIRMGTKPRGEMENPAHHSGRVGAFTHLAYGFQPRK